MLKRKSKKVVDFVTNDYMVYNYFKIEEGRSFIPSWWKDIDLKDTQTLKRCPGFINSFKYSYVMPLWTSIEIDIDKEGQIAIRTSDGTTKITSHDPIQRGAYLSEKEYVHIKLESPWLAYSKNHTQWNISPCSWNSEILIDKYVIPTSIRSFDVSYSTNIHGFIRRQYQNIKLKAGTPIVHMFPMTDRKPKVNCIYDPDAFDRLLQSLPSRFGFVSSYYEKRRIMKNKK